MPRSKKIKDILISLMKIWGYSTILFLSILLIMGCSTSQNVDKTDEQKREMKIKNSKNFKNGKFQNLDSVDVLESSWTLAMFKDQFFGEETREPKEPLPYVKLNHVFFKDTKKQKLRITWLGHSSVIIEIEGKLILLDPVFSHRISSVPLIGPTRFQKGFPLQAKDLPEIDAIIISHNHYDHMDKNTLLSLHQKTKLFFVSLAVSKELINWGVPSSKIIELDWWEENDIIPSIKIVATPSQHMSGRGVFNWNETLWASWVIAGREHRIFFSGDGGYFSGFKEIGKRYGHFDVTLLESGQYSKHWPKGHMNPKDAVKAHQDLNGNIYLPIHWGTFKLSTHHWSEPIEWAIKEARRNNITISTPKAGESLVYKKYIPNDRWWRR